MITLINTCLYYGKVRINVYIERIRRVHSIRSMEVGNSIVWEYVYRQYTVINFHVNYAVRTKIVSVRNKRKNKY